MSDRNEIGRRDMLTAGLAGIVGAAAGYALGRRRPESAKGLSERAQNSWTLEIKGGYGLLFGKNAGLANLTLLALAKDKCTCSQAEECIEHAMKLIAFGATVEVDARTTFPPTLEYGAMTWLLSGPTHFISGMPGKGITEPTRTPWDRLPSPFAPPRGGETKLWNDQVWLPEREKARGDARVRSSSAFLLTDGVLSVLPPDNEAARAGHWVYEGGRKKALTDQLRLTGTSDGLIGVETQTGTGRGQIYLKPAGMDQTMALFVRQAVILPETILNDGDPLHHFSRLYDFVDGRTCDNAGPAPTYKRWWSGGTRTPGNLCPPIPLG